MIFVFGSNEQGIHGGGAARVAWERHGAITGVGMGRQGNAFAIPTCKWTTNRPGFEIPLEKIQGYVNSFLLYASINPTVEFQVTQIGCGLAGWRADQIAPLFKDAPDNCYFDEAWQAYLPGKKFWGTF